MKTVVLVLISFLMMGMTLLESKPKMSGSDYPLYDFGTGFAANNMIPNFEYERRNYIVCMRGLAVGAFDITFMTMFDAVILERENPGHYVIIGILGYSNGGDSMVVRKEITSIKDLNDKAIVLSTESISFYLLHLILKKNNMSLVDVKIKHINKGENAYRGLSDARNAAFIAWNPTTSQAVKRGHVRLYSSAEFPTDIYDLIVVRRDTLEKHREHYSKFLETFYKSSLEDRVLEVLARGNGVDLPTYKTWLEDSVAYASPNMVLVQLPNAKIKAQDVNDFLSGSSEGVPRAGKKLFGKQSLNLKSLFDWSILENLRNSM